MVFFNFFSFGCFSLRLSCTWSTLWLHDSARSGFVQFNLEQWPDRPRQILMVREEDKTTPPFSFYLFFPVVFQTNDIPLFHKKTWIRILIKLLVGFRNKNLNWYTKRGENIYNWNTKIYRISVEWSVVYIYLWTYVFLLADSCRQT